MYFVHGKRHLMQKILVPTDFSPIADNALNYAIEIAAKFKSEILLYHCYSFHRKIDRDWNFPDDEQPYVKNIERKMNFTKGKFSAKVKEKGVVLRTGIEEENVTSLFTWMVDKYDISLIVMGSKGATGLEKMVLGSVAASALENARVPLLVVPPNYPFLPLNQIILATDLNKISESVLDALRSLALTFSAKVTFLNVDTDSKIELPKINDLDLKDVETDFLEVPMSVSVNQSINTFISQNKCDLLCMIRRKRGYFQRIFKTSISKAQLYDSAVPLLVFPED